MFESQEEYDYAMGCEAEADMQAAAEAAEGEAEQARILAEQEAEARKSVGLSDMLYGRITISRSNSNISGDYISIDIVVNKKHVVGEMALDDFAKCITGFARQPIKIKAI